MLRCRVPSGCCMTKLEVVPIERIVQTWNAMHMPHRRWIWLWAILPVAACSAGLWLTPLSLLPRYALAKSHWDGQGIRHYQLTAQFSQGADMSGPWMVEIRDDQVIA